MTHKAIKNEQITLIAFSHGFFAIGPSYDFLLWEIISVSTSLLQSCQTLFKK